MWKGDAISPVALNEYDAKTDTKKRITLRGRAYDYYHVTEFSDGKIELAPRVLSVPVEISENTLKMIDGSAEKEQIVRHAGNPAGGSLCCAGKALQADDTGFRSDRGAAREAQPHQV